MNLFHGHPEPSSVQWNKKSVYIPHSFLSQSPPSSSAISTGSSHLSLSTTSNFYQQRNPFIGRSQCVVCGDRARGCNFGAITCASCKEFFRRNAFKFNKLKCYFQSECEINIYSRRFCAACRLAKCYQMGMKSEYIMSDEEKYKRNMKIIERKLSTKNYDPTISGQKTIESGSPFNEYELSFDEKLNNHNLINYYPQEQRSVDLGLIIQKDSFHQPPIDHFKYNNNIHGDEYFATDNYRVNHCLKQNLNKIQQNKIISYKSEKEKETYQNSYQNLEDPETVIKLLKKVKIIRESSYSVNKFHLLLLAKDMSQQLSEHGSCKLKYLTSIVQILSAETVSDLPTDQKFIDLIRIAEIVTFNFIKMCKKLYAFQALSQEDQVALVKGGVMDTLMIWSMMTINLEKECWEALDLERNFRFSLKMEMLKEANPKLYEKHRSYVMSFEPEWRYDDNLMSLLIAIALFNPERPNLSNKGMIRNERNAYCNLLKLYLSTLYEESTSNEMYQRLMNQLKLTETISEYHMKAYFDLSANEATKNGYGGLIMEIFDLNN